MLPSFVSGFFILPYWSFSQWVKDGQGNDEEHGFDSYGSIFDRFLHHFLALGLSTSLIGNFFLEYQVLLRQLGAILMVFFGLVLTGILKFDFLLTDKKLQFQKRPSGYAGSVLIGIGFAAGWTPCTGPILAGVIALGVADPDSGLLYMLFYVLGFPFLFSWCCFLLRKWLSWRRRALFSCQ